MNVKECDFPDPGDLHFLQWQNTSPHLKWFYTPHRCLFILGFVITFFIIQPTNPLYKLYTFWGFSSIILSSCLQDGPLVRPHPFFWRIVLGFTLSMTITMLACSYLDREVIRQFLILITPNHSGDIPPDRDYSMSCTIWDSSNPSDPFHNVKAVVFDVFMVAHFLGWICKSILLRDTLTCWILSCFFEVVERLFKPWFPNFNECWWDSLILDILLCNGLGIYIGMKLVNFLVVVPWETRLLSECHSQRDKLLRMLKQFTPRSYIKYEWNPLQSPKRYFIWILVISMLLLFEMNVFALKTVLKITTTNILLTVLLFLHALIGAPSILEMYLYASNVKNTIGSYAASHILLILTESFLVWKFRDGYFIEACPLMNLIAFICIVIFLFIFPFIWFIILKKGQKKRKNE